MKKPEVSVKTFPRPDTAAAASLRKPDAPPAPELKKPDDGVVVELKNPGLCCQPKPKGNAPTVPLPAKSRVWVKAVSMGWSGLIVLASIS
ncbi:MULTISPECIES: hypothetical protein [Mycobacterium tuberculosis complex]|uniref:hypothetical protein n=1 Tax=Mycobacterium tuberculosis complex TaxID=77643 RepID=UPI00070FF5FB|nr:hypothetical protein [Mycobacterium tuberculosis]